MITVRPIGQELDRCVRITVCLLHSDISETFFKKIWEKVLDILTLVERLGKVHFLECLLGYHLEHFYHTTCDVIFK